MLRRNSWTYGSNIKGREYLMGKTLSMNWPKSYPSPFVQPKKHRFVLLLNPRTGSTILGTAS